LEAQVSTHSWSSANALAMIQSADNGVMVLLNCEETAEQLFAQFNALKTPDSRPQARAARMDLRTYGIGAQILKDVGVGQMRLLANPRKMPSMTGFNLEVTGYLDSSTVK
jgi:3,4-dihydroxy 2-butanone 4-phosphate synthase/GTP cyclohydrolase II